MTFAGKTFAGAEVTFATAFEMDFMTAVRLASPPSLIATMSGGHLWENHFGESA